VTCYCLGQGMTRTMMKDERIMKKAMLGLGVALLLATVGTIGCGDSGSSSQGTGQVRITLKRAQSCGDLEQMIKADALARMNSQMDEMIASVSKYGGYSSGTDVSAQGGGTTATPNANGATETTKGTDEAANYSKTNTQVDGVDEADIVKTDGKNIYLLHRNQFSVVKAWPADQLNMMNSLAIEGTPSEMFVENGHVVVYSSVDGTKVYEAAGVKARQQTGYGYGYGGPAVDVAAPGGPGGYYNAQPLTKITVLSLDGTTPQVTSEVYFEGNYLSSRRVNNQIRTVLTGAAYGPQWQSYPSYDESTANSYPQTKEGWIAAFEKLRAENKALIMSGKVSDWLPYRFTKQGDSYTSSQPSCDSYYVPPTGTTEYGLTQVTSFDWTAPQTIASTSIIGYADTVYANTDKLVLAAHGYRNTYQVQKAMSPQATGFSWSANVTYLHEFDLKADPSQPLYMASGEIPGSIKDQFALDESNGYLRVSSTERRVWITPPCNSKQSCDATMSSIPSDANTTVNHVYVLSTQSDELKIVGSTGDLAKGENIYSTRFLGDKAYVVTYRQVDPLFVIDLATPTSPKVLGELKIPGFSEYMHPMGPNHLLTIGQDTTVTSTGGTIRNGMALQIFDVTNPGDPKLAHKYVFEGNQGQSEALYNHKAFTYFAEKGMLAFPYTSWGNGVSGEYSYKSTLQLFKVSIDQGFSALGEVDHSKFYTTTTTQNYCGGYELSVRRGVFLEDFVYTISNGGITVNSTAQLGTELSSVSLPQPPAEEFQCYYY
jgi:uncharacterized secreted protein with C-terminal beta-propeller domain